MFSRRSDGNVVTRIGMPGYSHAWVAGEDAFQPASGLGRTISNDDLPGMLAEAYSHTAAMVE